MKSSSGGADALNSVVLMRTRLWTVPRVEVPTARGLVVIALHRGRAVVISGEARLTPIRLPALEANLLEPAREAVRLTPKDPIGDLYTAWPCPCRDGETTARRAVTAVENLRGRVVDLPPGVEPLLEVTACSGSTTMQVGARYRGLVIPLHVHIEDDMAPATSPRCKAAPKLLTISTFSCDIAYPSRPRSARASTASSAKSPSWSVSVNFACSGQSRTSSTPSARSSSSRGMAISRLGT